MGFENEFHFFMSVETQQNQATSFVRTQQLFDMQLEQLQLKNNKETKQHQRKQHRVTLSSHDRICKHPEKQENAIINHEMFLS